MIIDLTYVLEERQHLRIRRVIGNGEAQVRVAQNGSNSNETGSSTRHNADILPRILALFTLSVVLIVEFRNGRTQRLDTSGRAVLARRGGDRNGSRAGETAEDLIVCLGGTLTQVGPGGRVF